MEEGMFQKEVMKLIPIIGKERAYKLISIYLAGDEKTRKRMEELVDSIKAAFLAHSKKPEFVLFEPPPKEDVVQGEIYLGNVLYGDMELYSFYLSKQHLLSHLGIFGSTGYGKTNVVQHIVLQLAKLNVPVLIFDFSKRNYRDLIQLEEVRDKIKIYTLGRDVVPFRFNPLAPPPSISFSQWSKEFAEIFDHAYWMMGGGRHIVLRTLDELEGRAVKNLRLKDIRTWIYANEQEFKSSRERNWAATAKRALDSLCFREVGEIFDVDVGTTPEHFFSQPDITILELDALSSNDRTFVIEVMLQWIKDWLLALPEREDFKGVIVLEEAHHLLNREKTKKLGTETVMDVIFREIRELGIGIIYTDQHPSLISHTALGNTSTQIYMNLGLETKHASDVDDAAGMLNLESEEERNFLRRLPVGHALMFCRLLSFTKPFLIHFPKVPIRKGIITDKEVRAHMSAYLQKINEEEKMEKAVAEKERFKRPERTAEERVKSEIEREAEKLRAVLNSKQLKILKRIYLYEAAKASEIYKPMSISGTTFKREVSLLMENKLVDFSKLRINGQTSHVYYINDETRALCKYLFGASDIFKGSVDLEALEEFFTINSYEVSDIRDNQIILRRQNRMARIFIVDTTDRKELASIFEQIGERAYILTTDRKARNAVLQYVAQLKKEGKIAELFLKLNQINDLLNGLPAETVEA